MKLYNASVVLSLAILAAALPPKVSHELKESVSAPRGWTKGHRAPAHSVIELRIALPQPKWSDLERHLNEIRYVPCYIWGDSPF